MKNYAIIFSSFYKAAYARDLLQQRHIRSAMGKVPASMMKSCGYALYLEEPELKPAIKILQEKGIPYRELYLTSNSRD